MNVSTILEDEEPPPPYAAIDPMERPTLILPRPTLIMPRPAQPRYAVCTPGQLGELLDSLERGHVARVERFLEENPSFDISSDMSNGELKTPLHVACRTGSPYLIAVLLRHPAIEVNRRNKFGATPIFVACSYGNLRVVELLLGSPDVDINVAAEDGRTPLWIASYYGYTKVMKLLMYSGKQPDALKIATYFGEELSVVQAAASRGRLEAVSLLESYLSVLGKA